MSKSDLLTCCVPQGSILDPLVLIIFANDIVDVLRNSRIIKYADDTVLHVADNSIEIIESQLSDDLNYLDEWFKENEVILNLKKEKTEAMIFETAKCLAMLNRGLNVKYQDHAINVTISYRYLG